MADERIKDMPHITPIPGSWLPSDSTATGTGRSSFAEHLAANGIVQAPFDDFDGSGVEWKITETNGGTVKISPSVTAYGMPSRGVALLAVTTASGSKADIIRSHTGCVLGSSTPIVIVWRFLIAALPPDASTCTLNLGVQADDTHAVAVGINFTNAGITSAALLTQNGGFTSETITWPAGTYFNVRLTISETGTTVEVAPNDGAYSTVLVGVTAPPQLVCGPWARVNRGTSNGSGAVAIDYCDPTLSRLGLDAGSPVDQSSQALAPTSVTPAAIGTAAVGTGIRWAREDHVHAADGANVALTGLTSGDWATSPPTTLKAAINRMSALLKTLNSGTPIP